MSLDLMHAGKYRWRAPRASLLLASAALGNAVFWHGGLDPLAWNVSLILLGLAAAAKALESRFQPAPAPLGNVAWALVLLPAYALFQLVPFPARVVQWLSPARAALHLNALAVTDRFMPLAVDPATSWEHTLRLAAYITVFLIARAAVFRNRTSVWIPALPLMLVGAFEAVWSLMHHGGTDLMRMEYGTYVNRNHLAGLLEMTLPFPVLYAVSKCLLKRGEEFSVSRAVRFCAGAGLAGFLFVALLNTLCRMALFATVLAGIAISALLVLRRAKSRTRWIAAGSVVCVFGLLAFFLPSTLLERVAHLSANDVSVAERLQLWRQSIQLVPRFALFGCGPGGFATAISPYIDSTPPFSEFAHNDYLQALIELGVVVWSFAMFCLSLIMVRLMRHVDDRQPGSNHSLSIAAAASLLAMLVHNLADFNLYIPANAMVFAWVCGIASAVIAFGTPRIVFTSRDRDVWHAYPRLSQQVRTARPR
jgi:O-antigen ligase